MHGIQVFVAHLQLKKLVKRVETEIATRVHRQRTRLVHSNKVFVFMQDGGQFLEDRSLLSQYLVDDSVCPAQLVLEIDYFLIHVYLASFDGILIICQ